MLAITTAAAVIAIAVNVNAQCNAVKQGAVCLSNCNGGGIYVGAPDLITGMAISTFQLDFDPNNPWAPRATAGTAVQLNIPEALKAVPLTFTGAGASIDIAGPDGIPAANLFLPDFAPATGDSAIGKVNLPLPGVALKPRGGDQVAFGNFFKQTTLTNGDFNIRMFGYSDTAAIATDPSTGNTLNLCLDYVAFDVTTALTGLGGLTDAIITAVPAIIGGDRDTGVILSIPLQINSPSPNIILNSNTDAIFDMQYNGQKCGTVVLPRVSINPGINSYTAKGFFKPDPDNEAAMTSCRQMLSQFAGGKVSQVTVSNGRSSNMPSLDAAFGALVLQQTLPPNTEFLVDSAAFGIGNMFKGELAWANLIGHNPFNYPVSITHIKGTMYYNGQAIGTLDSPTPGFDLPPKGNMLSPKMKMNLKIDWQALAMGSKALIGRTVPVDVKSAMVMNINGYEAWIDYDQFGVPTHFVNPFAN